MCGADFMALPRDTKRQIRLVELIALLSNAKRGIFFLPKLICCLPFRRKWQSTVTFAYISTQTESDGFCFLISIFFCLQNFWLFFCFKSTSISVETLTITDGSDEWITDFSCNRSHIKYEMKCKSQMKFSCQIDWITIFQWNEDEGDKKHHHQRQRPKQIQFVIAYKIGKWPIGYA